MIISELIKLLQEMDGDRLVVLSKDPEGNGFGPLRDLGMCTYDPSFENVGIEELTPEWEEAGYGEEDVVEGVAALCLWP